MLDWSDPFPRRTRFPVGPVSPSDPFPRRSRFARVGIQFPVVPAHAGIQSNNLSRRRHIVIGFRGCIR